MKHKFFTSHLSPITCILLVAVLIFAACEKENKDSDTHERDIVYTVDEDRHDAHLTTDAEFDTLLEEFCDFAQEGSTVTFYNALKTQNSKLKTKNSSKEVTYRTTSREDIKRWMRKMEDEGRTVTVTYDNQHGTWNGIAYTNAPQDEPSYSFIPVDEWLSGTTWTARVQYFGYTGYYDYPGGLWTWTQFREIYNEEYLDQYAPICMETIAFNGQHYTFSGSENSSGDYSVSDSVVHTGSYDLYQISADSMIVYGWHDCTISCDMQSWLFTKVQ